MQVEFAIALSRTARLVRGRPTLELRDFVAIYI
jgi:hypothetical protein